MGVHHPKLTILRQAQDRCCLVAFHQPVVVAEELLLFASAVLVEVVAVEADVEVGSVAVAVGAGVKLDSLLVVVFLLH